jgi:DNA-binding response OmpR family regulator
MAKTILVVDDDEVLREGLETMLRRQGYRTLGADDGLAARKLIDGQHPDLVILDMMMPRWGGFAVLEHFRGRRSAPPFIMITASAGEKHRAYAQKIGAVDYIQKPFAMDQLLECVGKALEASSAFLRCRCLCGARIKAPIELRGHTRPCPNCSLPLVIHPEAPEDEGPLLATDEGPIPTA